MLPGMVSIYIWDGQRQRDTEVAMIAKTSMGGLSAILQAIEARHPYTTPAIVALDVPGGSAEYLAWIAAQTADVEGA